MIGRNNSQRKAVIRFMKYYLTGFILILFLFPSLTQTAFAQGSADIMHRRHHLDKQDLSVLVFKNTLVNIRKNNWAEIKKEIEKLHERLSQYKTLFHIDLKGPLNLAIKEKRTKNLLKLLAHEVFLSMQMQFHTMINSQISDYLDTETRLKKAEEGYKEILSGNIKRKNPEAYVRVEEAFLDAKIALGNPGINPLQPRSPSDLKAFTLAVEKIEQEIKGVYTYFSK